jgi:hypothetical protein
VISIFSFCFILASLEAASPTLFAPFGRLAILLRRTEPHRLTAITLAPAGNVIGIWTG